VSADPDRLWRLLPIVVRERDEEEGWPLRALLGLIGEQAEELRGAMWQLYADHFIETCQPWVIPYIADLVSGEPIAAGERATEPDTAGLLFEDLAGAPRLRPQGGVRYRADVANTIRYRRRKGTVATLDALLRDASGWMTHAVELRERLAVTQQVEHLRPQSGWADLRRVDAPGQVGGAFDPGSHTAAFCRGGAAPGRPLRTVGVFVWRLAAYPLSSVDARDVGGGWRRTFSPLGQSAPLFSAGRWNAADAGPVGEHDVAQPLSQRLLRQELEAMRPSLAVAVGGAPVPLRHLRVGSLDPWRRRPPGRTVVVDSERGRLAIGRDHGPRPDVAVSYRYGAPAGLGGGPYDRSAWRIERTAPDRFAVGGAAAAFATVREALAGWETAGRPNAVISIHDSRTYELPAATALDGSGWLAIEAADGERPLLVARRGGWRLTVAGLAPKGQTAAVLTLSGVAIEGHLDVAGPLRRLRLLHSTLVPGRSVSEHAGHQPRASLFVHAAGGPRSNRRLRVEVAFSVTGPLLVPGEAEGVWVLDSIVDGGGRGAVLALGRDRRSLSIHLERSTVLGRCRVGTLSATDVIVTRGVESVHAGCARFSYLPVVSGTVDRYACLPGDEPGEPRFASRRFGDPGYCQLAADCPRTIREGGSNGAEMGAFNVLEQPQREANLRRRLAEYLPADLEPRVVHVT
jgi:hypothetical protein